MDTELRQSGEAIKAIVWGNMGEAFKIKNNSNQQKLIQTSVKYSEIKKVFFFSSLHV